MGVTFTETVTLEKCTCAKCGVVYAIPLKLKDELRDNHETFYCPNGHGQWFPQDNEAERLRKELARKEQELADRVKQELIQKQKLLQAQNDLKRLTNGVCPCCNRTFKNLAAHMKTKHPEKVSSKR